MRILFVLPFLAAAPAAAQRVDPGQGGRGLAAYNANVGAVNGVNDFATTDGLPSREAAIRRAGAWGRCVAATAPDLSAIYLRTGTADPALQPVFRACLHRSGAFVGFDRAAIRRAALGDALAIR